MSTSEDDDTVKINLWTRRKRFKESEFERNQYFLLRCYFPFDNT
jgi:hypothetical protein